MQRHSTLLICPLTYTVLANLVLRLFPHSLFKDSYIVSAAQTKLRRCHLLDLLDFSTITLVTTQI